MKKVLMFFILIFAVSSGCKNEINVIKDYDEEYENLSSAALPKQKLNGEQVDFNRFVEQKVKSMNIDSSVQKMNYRLYINEEGKITNIKINRSAGNGTDEKIISQMNDWNIEPAFKNGQKIKFSYDLNLENIFAQAVEINEDEFVVEAEKMPFPVDGMEGILKNIVYPEEAKRNGIEGRVLVKAFIDTNGNVVKVEVLKGEFENLNQAAIDAMKKVEFEPAEKNGKPVKAQIVVPITFKL